MITIANYIGGVWTPPRSGRYFDDINPATGEVMARVPDSDAADVEAAVSAARAAWPAWRSMKPAQRYEALHALAEGIRRRLDELAALESDDNGKPLWLARSVDIPRAVSNFSFYAAAALHFGSESYEMGDEVLSYVLRRPLGVVGAISPWNLPLYLFTWKIAPALAAGNCVVAKPSEVTPLTAFELSRIAQEVGFPAGVLNIVHGRGASAGEAVVMHPHTRAVSFTGGTRTGRRIAELAARQFKKVSLELGGKNPNIIFADAPYDEALRTTVRSSFANQGQICLCGSRILVEASIYERFRDDLVERARALKVGDPRDPDTRVGAVVSESHMQKILSYIALAREEGGRILTGGERVAVPGRCKDGFFVAPTVIEGLAPTCRVNQEEIFGPVVTLIPFADEEEALSIANGVEYGLSATVWTQDLRRAHRMARDLEAGIVWINTWLLRDLRTPFGGTKASGMGREGGWEAMLFFTEPKAVTIQL